MAIINNVGGNVERVFIEISCEPIIPPNKTLTVAAVKPNTWLKVNSHKLRLFIKLINHFYSSFMFI